ncbi:hypothetical protein [Halomontanus rarus]|uniref:hypothetical protein n=1 Tax=Halomontanus rarus TaxID=3034020 RepID=UPI0023E85D3B|nr:hypothetical protein [Halovivax sp. TS33]
MSAAHRHTTPDLNRPADASSSHLEVPQTHDHIDSSADDASPPSVPPTDHSQAQSRSRSHTHRRTNENENTHALAARIEHTRLRTRVAALERELAASRRNQQAIVDQYERVLEDRECPTERRDRETESAVTGHRRAGTGDDVRSRTGSGSDSSSRSRSSSDSNGRLVDFGTHVRRLLATVAR